MCAAHWQAVLPWHLSDVLYGFPAAEHLLVYCLLAQTVPACPELYKNSFTYHTVQTTPPDYQECFTFLGARRAQTVQLLHVTGECCEGTSVKLSIHMAEPLVGAAATQSSASSVQYASSVIAEARGMQACTKAKRVHSSYRQEELVRSRGQCGTHAQPAAPATFLFWLHQLWQGVYGCQAA